MGTGPARKAAGIGNLDALDEVAADLRQVVRLPAHRGVQPAGVERLAAGAARR